MGHATHQRKRGSAQLIPSLTLHFEIEKEITKERKQKQIIVSCPQISSVKFLTRRRRYYLLTHRSSSHQIASGAGVGCYGEVTYGSSAPPKIYHNYKYQRSL